MVTIQSVVISSILFVSPFVLAASQSNETSGIGISAFVSDPKVNPVTRSGVGCSLSVIVGKNQTSVLFMPVDSAEGLRQIMWKVGSSFGRLIRVDVPGKLLGELPGSADGVWFLSQTADRDLRIYRLGAHNRLRAEGALRTQGTAAGFSWAREDSGTPWLILETLAENRHFIEAFRKEGSRWRAKGAVAVGNLLTPRAVPGKHSVISGQWVFSAERPPHIIPVEGLPDLAETYPGRDGVVTELNRGDLSVHTSTDDGSHWTLHEPPWREGTQFASPPEAIDLAGQAPIIRWVAEGRLVVMRFSGGKWVSLLETSVENVHGLSGPAVTVGKRLLLFALCYRTAPGETDSIRLGVVDKGSVQVNTVRVR